MRKEFTAISAFSSVLAFTAGAVLCMQVSQMATQPGADITAVVIWAIEAAFFGTAVYIWQSQVTVPGWIFGIVGLMVVRTALASVAGLILAVMQETTSVAVCLAQTSQVLPRACAMLFALMVCYPLRVFLPMRAMEVRRRGRGFADSAAVKSATTEADGENGLLIVTVKDRPSSDRQQPRRATAEPTSDLLAGAGIEGDVELPLSSILALFPESIVTDKALALCDTGSVAIPFDMIHPQLKEAQVVFTVAEIRSWLPPAVRKALVPSNDSDLEVENTLVLLPLASIVPQLPPEALELPAPSPPAWAHVEAESVVFATS